MTKTIMEIIEANISDVERSHIMTDLNENDAKHCYLGDFTHLNKYVNGLVCEYVFKCPYQQRNKHSRVLECSYFQKVNKNGKYTGR
jgi:hypothetical protein